MRMNLNANLHPDPKEQDFLFAGALQTLVPVENLNSQNGPNKPSEFEILAARFLLAQRSPKTREAYARDLRDFLIFLSTLSVRIEAIGDLTEKMILLWREQLQAHHTRFTGSRKRIVNTSVARKLSTLSSFFRYAERRGLASENLCDRISRPRLRQESRTNALSLEEVQTILGACKSAAQQLRDDPTKARNYRAAQLRYVVLSVLFSVGMRVEELCTLRIGDFEKVGDLYRLHMLAKGGETHSPLIGDSTARVIASYILEFRSTACNDEPLFIRAQLVNTPSKLHRSSVFDMVKAGAGLAGLATRISPHSCRATLATLLHNNKTPIGQIQDLLNHKNINTTSIYLKKSQEKEDAAALRVQILPKD